MTTRRALALALVVAAGVGVARLAVGCSFPGYEVTSAAPDETGDADAGDAPVPADGEADGEAEVAEPNPSVTIVSPKSLSTVSLDTARQFPIEVAFSNFLVSSTCGSLSGCGHAHVTVDGDNCNVDGGTWNVEILSAKGFKAASTATVQAGIAPCRAPMAGRKVVLSVELVKEGHGSLSPPVQDSIFVSVP